MIGPSLKCPSWPVPAVKETFQLVHKLYLSQACWVKANGINFGLVGIAVPGLTVAAS